MKSPALLLWLLAYSGLPVFLVPLALLFCFEGWASWRTHPANLPLAAASTLFLAVWPLSALASWLLWLLGRRRAAWIASVATAAGLLLLWLSGLALIVFAERRH